MTASSIVVTSDAEGLAAAVAARFLTRLADVQSAGEVPQVVLTGGRVAAAVYRAVAESAARTAVDWRRVEFWWGDERFLPPGDPERNETQVREALLDSVGVDPARVHPMPADTGQGAEQAAAAYAADLAAVAGESDTGGVPTFDVLMLGVGPDGHVASLFPDNPGLQERERSVVAVHAAPKPPPTRLSLTFPTLARAREVWFVVSGEDKAKAVRRALASGGEAGAAGASRAEAGQAGATADEAGLAGGSGASVPAAEPKGLDRTLWLIDEAAAQELPTDLRT